MVTCQVSFVDGISPKFCRDFTETGIPRSTRRILDKLRPRQLFIQTFFTHKKFWRQRYFPFYLLSDQFYYLDLDTQLRSRHRQMPVIPKAMFCGNRLTCDTSINVYQKIFLSNNLLYQIILQKRKYYFIFIFKMDFYMYFFIWIFI